MSWDAIVEPIVGGLVKYALARYSGRFRAYPPDQHFNLLIKLLRHEDFDGVLGLSVGTGHFANSVLTSILQGSSIKDESLKMRRVIVRSLDPKLAARLVAIEMLQPNLIDQLDSHLNGWERLCKDRNVALEHRPWSRFPPYHGIVLSTTILIHPWNVDESGKLTHVAPVLYNLTRKAHRGRYDYFRALFDSP